MLLAVGVGVGRLSKPSSPSPPIAVVVDDGANGHTRLTADVPVGYAHTEQGAVSAATNYLASLAKATVSNQLDRDQMIAALAAAGSAARCSSSTTGPAPRSAATCTSRGRSQCRRWNPHDPRRLATDPLRRPYRRGPGVRDRPVRLQRRRSRPRDLGGSTRSRSPGRTVTGSWSAAPPNRRSFPSPMRAARWPPTTALAWHRWSIASRSTGMALSRPERFRLGLVVLVLLVLATTLAGPARAGIVRPPILRPAHHRRRLRGSAHPAPRRPAPPRRPRPSKAAAMDSRFPSAPSAR